MGVGADNKNNYSDDMPMKKKSGTKRSSKEKLEKGINQVGGIGA